MNDISVVKNSSKCVGR